MQTTAVADRSGNPAFNDRIQKRYLTGPIEAEAQTMSIGGVAVKTLLDLVVLVAAGAWGWASATGVLADRYGFNAVSWMGAAGAGLSVVVLILGVWPHRASSGGATEPPAGATATAQLS